MTAGPRARRSGLEREVMMLAIAGALPAVLATLALVWLEPHTTRLRITLALLVVGASLASVLALRERLVGRLRTLSNLLAAVREGDFSLRARHARADDALGEVMIEVNALSRALQEQRAGRLEAGAILRRVLSDVDVAIVVFDAAHRLQLANRRAEELLGEPSARLAGRSAAELGLAACLAGARSRLVDLAFSGATGRWQVRRSAIREQGEPQELVVLSDVTHVLRQEERQAWQRLIRVLRHEINNSLAPIQSLSGSLADLVARNPRPSDWEGDLRDGLSVVAERSRSLGRFMSSYADLARVPPPRRAPLDVARWIGRVAELERRVEVEVEGGPELSLSADGDQLDQMLINLVRNAADAALETGGGVRIAWARTAAPPGAPRRSFVTVSIEDDGPGLPSEANLFVPFFTTKPQGSGVGLVLSREIVEGHGGTIALENREGRSGCRARVRLPLE